MRRGLSVLLTILMCGCVAYIGSKTTTKETEVETKEIIETQELKALTYEDYSRLYTLKQDVRTTNESIVELSQSDAWLLMQIARSEAGTDEEAQMWVMRVILNRLADGNFGDSIYEIISATGQFEVFSNGSYKTADIEPSTHYALAQIEGGWDETQNALYFEASTNTSKSWHSQNRTLITEISGQRYYK